MGLEHNIDGNTRNGERQCYVMVISRCFLGSAVCVAQLVEALRCKPEVRGFDSRWCHSLPYN